MTQTRWIIAFFALGLAGCLKSEPELARLPAVDADTCQGAQYAPLLDQDQTALERVLIMRQIRIIRPGDMVTMDYRAERINFAIDEQGKISRIYCG